MTCLDRTDITQIRPLLYCGGGDDPTLRPARLAGRQQPLPGGRHSRRQEVKELISGLEGRYPDLKKKLFGAVQRYPLYGWDLTKEER